MVSRDLNPVTAGALLAVGEVCVVVVVGLVSEAEGLMDSRDEVLGG